MEKERQRREREKGPITCTIVARVCPLPAGALSDPDITTLPDARHVAPSLNLIGKKAFPRLPLFQDPNGLWAHQISGNWVSSFHGTGILTTIMNIVE